ncbi:MAG: phage tail protein [Bacteroidales bacterium]|nr:phage tail protein [Candidatus Scybalousia scybalohippi]
MYKITGVHRNSTAEYVIYEPDNADRTLTECKLSLEVRKSGLLTMRIPTTNVERNNVQPLTDEIIFYRKNVELWRGRPITSASDFYLTGELQCEGILSYFWDTYYPAFEFNGDASSLFSEMVLNHNANVEEAKKFNVGNVTVNATITRSSEKPGRTLTFFNDKFQESSAGGYIRARMQNGKKYVDYIEDYSFDASQVVRFGENLIDLAIEVNYGSVITAILPLGAKGESVTDEETGETVDGTYLTVEEVNGGSIYVSDQTAVNKYGWIYECIEWPDITIPDNLLSAAREELPKRTNPIQTIKIRFVDMAMITDGYTSFYLGDKIMVDSSKHGISQRMMLTAMNINPLDPEDCILEFGTEQSLTDTLRKDSVAIEDSIEQERKDRHSAYEALQRALADGEGMFISYEEDSEGGKTYYLHNNKNLEDSEYVIKVNSEAMGFSTDGGKTYPFGFTINGDMVMKIIETEGLRADWVYFTNQETGEKDGTITEKLAKLTLDNGEIRTLVASTEKKVDKAISKVETFYYLSTSATGQTGGAWSTTVPTTAQMKDKYVWTKQKTTFVDLTTSETKPVLLGKNIKSLTQQYAVGTSQPAESSTSWKNGTPTSDEVGTKKVWTRQKIEYEDGTVDYSTPILSNEWETLKRVSSEIEQLSNAITLSVKYDNDPKKGGKLRLGENSSGTGVEFTVDSTNFRVKEDGTTEIGEDADWFEVAPEGLIGYRRRNTFTFRLPHNRTGKSLYLIGFSVTGNSSTYSVERTGRELQKEFLEKIRTRNADITNITFDAQRGDGYAYLSIETKDLTVTNIAQLMKVGTSVTKFTLTVADTPLGNGTLLLTLNGTSSNITTTLSTKVSTGTVIKYDSIKTDEVRAKRLYSNGNLIGDRFSAGTITYQTLDAATRKQVCSITFPQAGTYLVSFKLKFAKASTSGNGTCLGWASNNSDCDSASAIAGSNCGIFHNSSDPYTISATFPWTVYSDTEPLYFFARATIGRGVDGNIVATGIG